MHRFRSASLRHPPMKPPRPWQGSGRWSGYRDSNPGPPAPKAGALTGLRYIPFVSNGAKITHFQQTPNPIGFHAEKTPPPQIIPALSDQTASLRPSSKPPWLAAPSPPAAVHSSGEADSIPTGSKRAPFPAPSPLGASTPPRSRPQPSSPPGSVPCLTVSARRRRPPRYRYGDRHRHEYEYRHKYKDRNDTGTGTRNREHGNSLRLGAYLPTSFRYFPSSLLSCLCRFSSLPLPLFYPYSSPSFYLSDFTPPATLRPQPLPHLSSHCPPGPAPIQFRRSPPAFLPRR